MMIFEKNPIYWLMPVISKGQDDMDGIEWDLKTFFDINDVV